MEISTKKETKIVVELTEQEAEHLLEEIKVVLGGNAERRAYPNMQELREDLAGLF